MAIFLHSVSTKHLRGALLFATTAGIAAAAALRSSLGYQLLVSVAWGIAVLSFIVLVGIIVTRYDEAAMARKVRNRAPSSFLVGSTALAAALFGIYAIVLLLSAG